MSSQDWSEVWQEAMEHCEAWLGLIIAIGMWGRRLALGDFEHGTIGP